MFKKILIITAAALFTFACGRSNEGVVVTTTAAEVPNVELYKVSRSSFPEFYEATGTVEAKTATQVSANVMGRIQLMAVSEGDKVSRGQLLVQIDSRQSGTQVEKAQAALREAQASLIEIDRSAEAANAAIRTAEANRSFAEVTAGRFKELFDRKSASAQEYDEARSKFAAATSELERAKATVQTILSKKSQVNARIEQARAEIAGAEINKGYARIVSPVSGVVVKKFAETGATATPGTPLLSIEDDSQYRLAANVEESRARSMQLGSRVAVTIDALGQGEFFGTVAEILPSSDAASRSLTVKVDLPPHPQLRSGIYGTARFSMPGKNALTVPQSAIVLRGQLTGVYVVGQDGIAVYRIVTLGSSAEGNVEVLSGISDGDQIVASGTDRIKDGSKVR